MHNPQHNLPETSLTYCLCFQCGAHCVALDECEAFTYVTQWSNCWLKGKGYRKGTAQGVVSGLRSDFVISAAEPARPISKQWKPKQTKQALDAAGQSNSMLVDIGQHTGSLLGHLRMKHSGLQKAQERSSDTVESGSVTAHQLEPKQQSVLQDQEHAIKNAMLHCGASFTVMQSVHLTGADVEQRSESVDDCCTKCADLDACQAFSYAPSHIVHPTTFSAGKAIKSHW